MGQSRCEWGEVVPEASGVEETGPSVRAQGGFTGTCDARAGCVRLARLSGSCMIQAWKVPPEGVSLIPQQVGGRENVYGQDVKFWSWVGPYRPTTDPPGGTWDDWEDCLVISAGPRVSTQRPKGAAGPNHRHHHEDVRLTHSRSWSHDVRMTSRSTCSGRSSSRET